MHIGREDEPRALAPEKWRFSAARSSRNILVTIRASFTFSGRRARAHDPDNATQISDRQTMA
jgi:hypothetical protein